MNKTVAPAVRVRVVMAVEKGLLRAVLNFEILSEGALLYLANKVSFSPTVWSMRMLAASNVEGAE